MGKLSIQLQKCKCNLEFVRLRIIYKLTPTFVKITLWEKKIKATSEYRSFQHYCLQQEYKNHFKDSIKYEKELNELLKNLKSIMNRHDLDRLHICMIDLRKLKA